MLIEFKKVIPAPIPEEMIEPSEIWDSELRLETGSLVLVSAHSGKGKSTLLHLLYGLRNDYEGEALADGESIRGKSRQDWETWRRRRVALLFQDLRLFPALSARENLELIPVANPRAPSHEEMAERLGMTSFLERPLASLSQGQRQRVALMRVLRKPFELLLLDEPFSHLDEENTRLACALVEEVTQANKAGLILTSLGETPALPFERSLVL
ncbi:MAG TPA: ABC transporter [Opitutae bacterium]|nr:ABC transporter [Opitutae bacterium]|tara:strand:- start:464 stop:1099 length:636 start_codon:yes stop_codon:yes gene_type:complete